MMTNPARRAAIRTPAGALASTSHRRNRSHERPALRRRFQNLRVCSLSDSLSYAGSLLPALEEAKRIAEDKQEPAIQAENRWRAELEAESIIKDRLDRSLAHLEESCQRVLALPSPSPAVPNAPSTGSGGGAPLEHQEDMVMHHMNWRFEQFLARNENVRLWKAFRGSVTMNAFHALGRGHLGTQVAACCIDEVPWLVCVASDPLVDFQSAPKGLLLHWSVTDDEASGWHNSIPRGWSTHPGVCEPHGSEAWQTTMAHYNPKVGDEALTQIPVHSVIIQIPMDGIFLEKRGGIKFILKRNDTSDEVWIKSTRHGDFYLSLAPAIDYLNPPTTFEENTGTNQKDAADATEADSDEELSSKFVWARSLAEGLIIAREKELAQQEAEVPYAPSYAWLDHVTSWLETTDYAINRGSSLSQYAKELRCLLELTEEADLLTLKDACATLESDIQAFDAAEIQQRSLQLEKDRLWEERELAIKEAARVHLELTNRVDSARRAIVAAGGRDKEVCERDLVDLCSSMVLGSKTQGKDHGAGFFRRLFGGSESPIQHMMVAESIDQVDGVAGNVVTQVYFEGEASAVDAVMNAEQDQNQSQDAAEVETRKLQEEIFPFDTVLIAIAFAEDFPSKLSHSNVSLHMGFVTGKNGGWIPPTPGTMAAIHRGVPAVPDQVAQGGGAASPGASVQFEAFHIRHKSGGRVLVDPLVRGIVLRVPVSELRCKCIAGIEFVVVSSGSVWMKKEGGSNFFAPIPLIRE